MSSEKSSASAEARTFSVTKKLFPKSFQLSAVDVKTRAGLGIDDVLFMFSAKKIGIFCLDLSCLPLVRVDYCS